LEPGVDKVFYIPLISCAARITFIASTLDIRTRLDKDKLACLRRNHLV
jgi:hypothetical protein